MSFQFKEPPKAATLPFSGQCKGKLCATARTDKNQEKQSSFLIKRPLGGRFFERTMQKKRTDFGNKKERL